MGWGGEGREKGGGGKGEGRGRGEGREKGGGGGREGGGKGGREGMGGREGGGKFRGVLLGGCWSSPQREKLHQKFESIPPSIFAERKLEPLYVELTSSLSLAQHNTH